MPAKLKVRIVAGRDLPVMDRASELTDAFVEVKFSSTTYKTEVCRKSLNPQWNSDWFRFEVDDEDLQDEPLQIKVLDHDTYSAHDAIGKIYIELNPLLSKEHGSVISGWFPIYDTMHGIRGELHVIVKLDLFSDFNKFRQSSCGIQFFCTSGVPYGYHLHAIQGFVEELVVNDDPEYQWIDKIRSQRASNEARQIQFSKLSGELQRKLGLKVLELGGNAVIGYRQCFDLEGESGVVVRAIGTSVSLAKHGVLHVSPNSTSPNRDCASDPNFWPLLPQSPTAHFARPLQACTNTSSFPRLWPLPSITLHTVEGRPAPLAPPRPHSPRPLVVAQGDMTPTLNSLHLETPKQTKLTKKSKSLNLKLLGSPRLRRSQKGLASPKSPRASKLTMVQLPASGGRVTGPKSPRVPCSPCSEPPECFAGSSLPLPEDAIAPASPTTQTPTKMSTSPSKVPHQRRSSDSDIGTPPKGGSLAGSEGSGGTKAPHCRVAPFNVDALEFPFFTIKSFSPGFLVHIGGMVSARSVKLLDKIHNPDDPETRDVWWTELRTEIRSHARAMGCHAVIGYVEQTSICEEIIVLSASGTAAIINLNVDGTTENIVKHTTMSASLDRAQFEKEKEGKPTDKKLHVDVNLANQLAAQRSHSSDGESINLFANCSACHIPYNESSLPFPVNLARCAHCKRHKVPDVLFTTIEVPKDLPVVGRGCLVQARICRPKKEAKGETNAKEISDSLPFMEYELYNQLLNKIKIRGMNSLFSLKIQVVVGEQMLVAVGTGTSVYSAPLPPPAAPKVLGKMESAESSLTEIQKKVLDAVNRNKDIYNLFLEESTQDDSIRASLTDDEEDLTDVELVSGNRDTFILEVDDAEDAAEVSVLLDQPPPDGFDVCTTETMPGVPHLACSLQMFTRVWRGSLTAVNSKAFSSIFDALLRSMYFKLRTMVPCVLCHLGFDVELHDEDDIQVSMTGICMGVGEQPSLSNGLISIAAPPAEHKKEPSSATHEHEDMMFAMDGFHENPSTSHPPSSQSNLLAPGATLSHSSSMGGITSTPLMYHKLGHKTGKSERRIRYYSGPRKQGGIELTPLTYVPFGKIEHYLGHLNFFLIRETTSVREIGGLNGFIHSFISEVMAICRAHVAALGGNALVSYQMTECVLDDHLHKNQGHCLVNVCGDVVQVLYEMDLHPLQTANSSGRSMPGRISPLPQVHTKRITPRTSPQLDRAPKST